MGWLPWVGEGLSFLRAPFRFFAERVARHGPVFRTRIFGNRVIALTGADAFDLVNDATCVTRVGASPGFVERLFDPDAIPFLSGEPHLRRRRFLRAAFEPEAIDGYRPRVRAVLERHVAAWADAGEVVARESCDRAAFDLANALFFAADPTREDRALEATFARYGKGFASVPIALPFTAYGKALAARDVLRAHCADRIAAASGDDHVLGRLARSDADDDVEPATVVVELVHAATVAQQALRAALVDVLWAFARDPSLVATARRAACDGDRGFLDQVTREARRYFKILPITGLSTLIRDVEYGGYALPAGWKVAGVIHASMMDPAVVDSPERFDPARFAGGAPPYYLAHGGGPDHGHRCAGEPLADMVLAAFLEVTLPDCDLAFPEQDLTEKTGGFAPLPRSGLRTRFLPRRRAGTLAS